MFKEREGINTRNAGNSSLTLEGTAGMVKTKLTPGWECDLGEPSDPNRGVVRNTVLGAGETMAARTRDDWYGALVMAGSVTCGGKTFGVDDVLLAERGSAIPEVKAGPDGAQLLEHFRTSRAL